MLEAAGQVTGVIGDNEDLDQFDAEPRQLLREPGAVAVTDGGVQNLGTGHQDAGTHLTLGTAPGPEYVFA